MSGSIVLQIYKSESKVTRRGICFVVQNVIVLYFIVV